MSKFLAPSAEVFAEMALVDPNSIPDDKKPALFVPVLVVLRDSRYHRSANLLIAALDYTLKVLEKRISLQSDMFVEFFMRLGVICDQQNLISPADMAEIRLSSFNLAEKLLSTQSESNLGQLFTARCLPALGHMISLLLNAAESTSSSPSLRLVSLRCLRTFISPPKSLQSQTSIVVLTFMPGILTSLANILKTSSDPRTSHSLLVESLSALEPAITTVLCDRNVDEKGKEGFFANCPPDGFQRLSSAGILPPLPLTLEHLQEVGRRVSPVLAAVFAPSLFSTDETVDLRVRNRAFQTAVSILSKSAQFLSLTDACCALLNCVVASLADWDEKSQEYLDELEQVLVYLPKLGDQAEDSFMDLVRSLPRFVAGNSIKFEVILSAKLASMIGYSRLLGKTGRLSQLFSSHDCLMDLFRCATRTCQLQPASQAALGVAPAPPPSNEIASAQLDDKNMWQIRFPRQELPFRYLDNFTSRRLFETLIEAVARQVDDSSNLVSFFYETMVQQLDEQTRGDDFRLESSTYILSLMISHLSTSPNVLLETQSIACAERFCMESNGFVRNRSSLLLLAACSKALRSNDEAIATIVRQSILLLLEACSSGKSFIENHAIHTLVDVAKSSGARTLAHFIENNADYLANAFSLRLRHLAVSRNTLYAIAAAFRFSVPGCLRYFSDPLRDIISHIPTSDYDPELAELLLLATNNAMSAISRWNLPCVGEEPPPLEEEEDENPVRNANKTWPDHIILARDTADAVAVLFSSHQVYIKLAALEIARLAVLIVRPATNELLPLVHRLWPGVAARFIPSETRKQIILKSLDLLIAIAETSGDFIRHRFVTGMLPHICTAIAHLVETLTKSGIRLTVYRQTFDYKLLVRLVVDLPRLANFINITVSSDLQKITESILSALCVAVEIGSEAESLKKASIDGLSLLLLENADRKDSRKCVRVLIENRTTSNPKLCEIPILSQ